MIQTNLLSMRKEKEIHASLLRKRETTSTYILFQYIVITVLFIIIVVNILLCLIYKLNYIMGMYVYKNHSLYLWF